MKPYYDDGQIQIFHGDCREVLPTLDTGSIDLVLTDPPYGIGFDYGAEYADAADGYGAFIWSVMKGAERATKSAGHVVCFQSATHARQWAAWFPREWRLIALPKTFVQIRPTMLQWATDYALWWSMPDAARGNAHDWQGTPNRDWFLSQDASRPRPRLLRDHPCPRPLDMVAYILSRLAPPNAVVLDPFMGSGTTLRAAKDLGRRAIGIEIEERYCEIAAKRLSQSVMDLTTKEIA